MQLLLIHAYNNPASELRTRAQLDGGFTSAVRTAHSDYTGDVATPEQTADRANFVNSDLPLYLHLEDFLAVIDGGDPYSGDLQDLAEALVQQYDSGGGYSDPGSSFSNTVILRNGNTNGWNMVATATGIPTSMFNSDYGLETAPIEAIAERIVGQMRNYTMLWRGNTTEGHSVTKPSKSEVLMYVVEKRVVDPGATEASGEPVQTFFFAPDVIPDLPSDRKGIVYYDTQIKYGVRYQYDIREVRLVIGNRYQYSIAQTVVNDDARRQGRAIGNALGFFAPERAVLTNTHSFQDLQYGTMPANWGLPAGLTAWPPAGTTWLAEDGELDPIPPFSIPAHGFYVYRWPSWSVGVANYLQALDGGVFLPGTDPNTGLPYVSADWDKILLKVKVGDGFDGYASGGLIAHGSTIPTELAETIDAEGVVEFWGTEFDIDEVEEIEDQGGEDDQSGSQDTANAINTITIVLGSALAEEVTNWVNDGGPFSELLDIIDIAGAGGIDPLSNRGDWISTFSGNVRAQKEKGAYEVAIDLARALADVGVDVAGALWRADYTIEQLYNQFQHADEVATRTVR